MKSFIKPSLPLEPLDEDRLEFEEEEEEGLDPDERPFELFEELDPPREDPEVLFEPLLLLDDDPLRLLLLLPPEEPLPLLLELLPDLLEDELLFELPPPLPDPLLLPDPLFLLFEVAILCVM